jgi:two-component system, LytTR family, response regulator
MKIRALIVDDEALARGRIRNALADERDLEIIGECANGPEAIEFMRNRRPDLVFLDVQMPEVNGFEVLRALPSDAMPAVIFVTAHDQHAIQAFEIHALDYLLKPFTKARLMEALGRARKQVEASNSAAVKRQLAELAKVPQAGPAWLSRIAIKSNDRTLFIKVGDIDYIKSASNYVVLSTQTNNHILRETMSNLETKLSPKLFLRISRSIIVNLDRVRELQPGVQGEHVIILQNNTKLIMTRGLREVQERLQYS